MAAADGRASADQAVGLPDSGLEFDMLVVGASFFGYVGRLITALEARGRRPMWFEDRPGTDTYSKLMLRVAPRVMVGKTTAYIEGIIAEVRHQPIKDILVIKGEAITTAHIEMLRRAFPQARFVLYLWDSYGNMPRDTPGKVGSFDQAFSFDPRDVERDTRLSYRPLFYLPEFQTMTGAQTDIDVLFLGTVHSDRFEVTDRLARSLPSHIRFERINYFPSRRLFYIKRVARPGYWRSKIEDFTFTPITRENVLKVLARSRIVLDVERSVQTGYTMRTIEAVGASKKIATTNPAIMQADFYSEGNQTVLDRAKPRIPTEFFEVDYTPIAPATLVRYNLDCFLTDLGY